MIPALLGLVSAPVICIDPGHPSEVGRGTTGRRLSELRFAWTVAKTLKSRLETRGYSVRLTKSREGEFVPNIRRSQIANAAGASLFLRLHCDAASNSGSTIYYPDRQGTAKGGFRGPSTEVLRVTRAIAPKFYDAYARQAKGRLRMNGLHSDVKTAVGSKQGALTGSIYSQVPVLLVEMVVLTNPKDEAFALSKRGQGVIVDALEAGTIAVVPLRGGVPSRAGTAAR